MPQPKQRRQRKPADLVVRAPEVEAFAMPGEEHVYLSQCLIDGESVGSKDLNVNRGTLKAGQRLKGGSHPVGSDECYYVLHGRAWLTLGGDPQTGEGGERIEIGPETAVFIPGGTYHALENPFPEDLVILTLWPRLPKPGENGVYDARLAAWGTSFRKRPGLGTPPRQGAPATEAAAAAPAADRRR